MSEELDRLIQELEDTAARLRGGELEADEAAATVERCAELAGRIGSGLEAESRAAEEARGQERLL